MGDPRFADEAPLRCVDVEAVHQGVHRLDLLHFNFPQVQVFRRCQEYHVAMLLRMTNQLRKKNSYEPW